MKMWKKILTSTFLYVIWIASTFAATVDHFTVSLIPESVKVWESLDLTIEAVDKNWVTVTDYQGTVLIFSESDAEASLPIILEDNTYTFKSSDLWKTKFENAVKFSKEWTQNIYVYDFDNDLVFGIAEAKITGGSVATSSKEVTIISPENWTIIWDNKIKVSGTSEKNHQIKLLINWVWDTIIMTNNEWIFEKDVTNLQEWENVFVAKLLDADGNETWTSNEVKIKVDKNTISLTNVKVTPEEVETEWAFELEVLATPGLKEVSAIINDIITKVEEKESWKYLAKMYAPKEEWVYPIDVTLKDDIWHEKKELWASSITVKAPTIIVEEPKEPKCKENEELVIDTNWNSECIALNSAVIIWKKSLKITWLKLVELKSKSILTWDELKDAKSYNVYKKAENWNLELITNVKEPIFEVLIDMTKENIEYEYFAIKAVAETDEWEVYEWDLSEATKIQTWPEEILLLLLALLLWWIIMVAFRRKV